MPILSPDEHAALKAWLDAHPGLTDAQAYDAIHAPGSVPNPSPQGQVPAPFTLAQLLSTLDAAAVAKVYGRPGLPDFGDRARAGDRLGCVLWTNAALAAGDVTQAQHDAIIAALTAAVPDPSWPANVPAPPWAATNLGAFGTKHWTDPAGHTFNTVPIEAIAEART